jgi:uncharacterized Zn finger protein
MPDSAAGWEVPCKHIVAAFHLAEAFDDDPFTILARRGREREDLLASQHAVRSDGPPVANGERWAGGPFADCPEPYITVRSDIPLTSPPVTASGSLLEQLPPVNVTVRG